MGGGSWTNDAWRSYASAASTKSTAAIFSTNLKDELNPHGVEFRESVDSADNPESTAIMIFTDVTGSMGMLADNIVRTQCGVLMKEILDRKPVTDPHVLFGAIGDVKCDRAPLQIGQFEADIRVAQQLEKIWLEGHGGGNSSESYHLPWYFAAKHTTIDCFTKRGKKGYLFTMGDELPPPDLLASEVNKVFGYNPERNYTLAELLDMASERYHVFHLIIEQGSGCGYHASDVVAKWQNIMGQRVIPVADYTKLAEIIVSTIQVVEGDATADTVADTWSGSTAVVVRKAVANIGTSVAVTGASTGVARI